MTNEEFQIVLAHYYRFVLDDIRLKFNESYVEMQASKARTKEYQAELETILPKPSIEKWEAQLSGIDISSLPEGQKEQIHKIQEKIKQHREQSQQLAEIGTILHDTYRIEKERSEFDTELIKHKAQRDTFQSSVDLDELHQEMDFEIHEKKGIEIAKSLNIDCSDLPPNFYSGLSIAAKEASKHAIAELIHGERHQIPTEYNLSQPSSSAHTGTPSAENHNISDLFDLFYESSEEHIEPATLKKKKSIFKEFTQIVGDINVSDLTHELGRNYVDALKQLPSNYAKKYNPNPLEAIKQAPEANKTSAVTINDKIRSISYFFDWCINQGYFQAINSHNVLKGKALKVTKGGNNKNTYQPYTKNDLRNLFGETYIKQTTKKAFHFWLPLLGLYTGARISEIVMLKVADLKLSTEGIHYLEFCSYFGGKTVNSHRTMPVHADLIELGFLNFVNKQKKNKQDRILSCVTIPSNPAKGRGNNASKWFNDTYLKKLKKAGLVSPAKPEKKKTFHSFRGTAITNLRENKANTSVINTVIGHADFSMQGKYSDQYSVEFQYKEVVSKLRYNEIDLELLKKSRHAIP